MLVCWCVGVLRRGLVVVRVYRKNGWVRCDSIGRRQEDFTKNNNNNNNNTEKGSDTKKKRTTKGVRLTLSLSFYFGGLAFFPMHRSRTVAYGSSATQLDTNRHYFATTLTQQQPK